MTDRYTYIIMWCRLQNSALSQPLLIDCQLHLTSVNVKYHWHTTSSDVATQPPWDHVLLLGILATSRTIKNLLPICPYVHTCIFCCPCDLDSSLFKVPLVGYTYTMSYVHPWNPFYGLTNLTILCTYVLFRYMIICICYVCFL